MSCFEVSSTQTSGQSGSCGRVYTASTSSIAATNALLAFGGMTQCWRRWGWETVQASGVAYSEAKAEAVRAILAKHIIAAARDGERDYARLRDGALLALAQSNLSSASLKVMWKKQNF